MRNQFETKFWQKAYESLPPSQRERFAGQIKSAEHWELGLTAGLKLASRAAAALARALRMPTRSPSH